jgi:hypothetical protein
MPIIDGNGKSIFSPGRAPTRLVRILDETGLLGWHLESGSPKHEVCEVLARCQVGLWRRALTFFSSSFFFLSFRSVSLLL